MNSASHLSGKRILVTGGSRGIGLAIAERCARAGARVAIAARNAADLEDAKRRIAAPPLTKEGQGAVDVLTIPADASKPDEVARMMESVQAGLGGLDILVNNAGLARMAMVEAMAVEDFDAMAAANMRGVFLCSRAAWPLLRAAGGGAIVNIASMSAFDPFPGLGTYGAMKAFVVAFTKSLAAEGAEQGIRVFGIAPGAVETRMLRAVAPTLPSDAALPPDAIAMAVESILSPAFAHSSGQTIIVAK